MSLDAIKKIVGSKGFLETPKEIEPYTTAWRGGFKGRAELVAFPSSVTEVAEIVKICGKSGIFITPQGGNTGLVGGGVPNASGKNIIINLSRMNKVRELNTTNFTVTAEAGFILSNLQEYCEQKGFLFPLSMASEGSAQVGGFVSTNAGGTAVLRYGTTRELTLGIEAVLPDGSVFEDLRQLRKNNTGYDLKQLLIGGEGTLGIITAACFKLFLLPKQTETALIAVESVAAAVELFNFLRNKSGDTLSAFELISHAAMAITVDHIPDMKAFFTAPFPYYVLVEASTSAEAIPLRNMLETTLEQALQKGLVSDAIVAESIKQAERFWLCRESISEAEKKSGKGVHFDISLPIAEISAFIKAADGKIAKTFPDIMILPFGHIGDGNIHYNLCIPQKSAANKDFKKTKDTLKEIVYALLVKHNGSISAEHGIGVERKNDLHFSKGPVAIEAMKRVKATLDPKNIMNPGKMLDI